MTLEWITGSGSFCIIDKFRLKGYLITRCVSNVPASLEYTFYVETKQCGTVVVDVWTLIN